MVSAYQEIGGGGTDLGTAIVQTNQAIGLEVPDDAIEVHPSSTAAANDKALADLKQMIGGIA